MPGKEGWGGSCAKCGNDENFIKRGESLV